MYASLQKNLDHCLTLLKQQRFGTVVASYSEDETSSPFREIEYFAWYWSRVTL